MSVSADIRSLSRKKRCCGEKNSSSRKPELKKTGRGRCMKDG